MNKIILVIENQNEVEKLCNCAKEKGIEVKVFTDGEEAYEYVCNEKVEADAMIMDVALKNVSGMEILGYMNKNKIGEDVIKVVQSSKELKELLVAALYLGANYATYKPKYPEHLIDIIEAMINAKNKKYDIDSTIEELENRLLRNITDKLHRLGVPSNLKGFKYLLEGIRLVYNNPNYTGKITKKLYPEIALKYDSTPSKVERAMRHALTVCWLRGDIDYINKIFKYSVGQHQDKPTNSTFIITLADYIRLRDSDKIKTQKK